MDPQMSGISMVRLITWSDNLKTGQKSVIKSQMFRSQVLGIYLVAVHHLAILKLDLKRTNNPLTGPLCPVFEWSEKSCDFSSHSNSGQKSLVFGNPDSSKYWTLGVSGSQMVEPLALYNLFKNGIYRQSPVKSLDIKTYNGWSVTAVSVVYCNVEVI